MRILEAWLIFGWVLTGATSGYAETTLVDCRNKSRDAVKDAADKNPIVNL